MKSNKSKLCLMAVTLVAACANAQELATRRYKVGEIDQYKITLKANTTHGELVQTSKLTQKVLKVFPNGEAEIESVSSEVNATIGGINLSIGDGKIPSAVSRFNKFGVPALDANVDGYNTMYASQYALLGIQSGKDIVVGKEFKFDEKKTNGAVRGTSKIVSVEGSVMSIRSNVTVVAPSQPEEMQISTLSTLDFASSRINKFELEVLKGFPTTSAFQFHSLKIVMTRIN